jgi:hypothetical protein
MSKKILLFIIIPFLLLLIIGIIIYIVKHNSHSNSNSKQKKVMFGLALQTNTTNTQIIDLAKLKGKITCFWNWKSFTSIEQLKIQYNWSQDLNIQFLPMLWGSTTEPTLPPSYNYVMLSNEPDMIGGCVDPKISPCFDGTSPATSSGYWISNGDYGCFTDISSEHPITKCTPDSITIPGDKNTFSYLIDKFIGQCKKLNPNTIVVSPAMSQNATGTCDAYKTAFDGDVPKPASSGPDNCNNKGCTCNGWLSLLKTAALAGSQDYKDWWHNTLKVISIHAYYKYSHHVKNKILEYMDEFKDDIDKGKEIWLTEVAYVSTNSDTYIQESADFAKTLLYANSSDSSIPTSCPADDKKFVLPGVDLPGLLTTTPFLFNGKTASWFDHGLTCVTWFCVDDWANFPTGCNGVDSPGQSNITSYPFTGGPTGKPNELYHSLFP